MEDIKWKSLELPFPKNKASHKLGGSVGISVTIKDLKDSGPVIPTTPPTQFTYLACAKNRWTLENNDVLL